MSSHSLQYKSLISKIVFYGDITLDTVLAGTGNTLEISYDDGIAAEWRPAIDFGVSYFYEHYSRQTQQSLHVKISRLHTIPLDSSLAVVFYVTVKCLCEALQYETLLVDLNEYHGRFVIQK